jgi:hypothetical protein
MLDEPNLQRLGSLQYNERVMLWTVFVDRTADDYRDDQQECGSQGGFS